MSKHRKSWSESDKTSILAYYREHGVALASREFNVASSVIYRWANQEKISSSKSNSDSIFFKKDYSRLLVEKENDLIVAKRQKCKAMAWSKKGSRSLALVTAYHNAA